MLYKLCAKNTISVLKKLQNYISLTEDYVIDRIDSIQDKRRCRNRMSWRFNPHPAICSCSSLTIVRR